MQDAVVQPNKELEDLEKFLRSRHDELIEALNTIGIKPLFFFQRLEEIIRKIETNSFLSMEEKNSTVIRARNEIINIAKVMFYRCKYEDKERLMKIMVIAKSTYIPIVMGMMRNSMRDAYMRNSHYWNIIYKFVRMHGITGSIVPISTEFFRTNSEEFIDYEEATNYITAVINLDKEKIKRFETLNSAVMSRENEFYEGVQWDLLMTMDIMSLLESNTKKYTGIYSLELSYPRRWAICGKCLSEDTKINLAYGTRTLKQIFKAYQGNQFSLFSFNMKTKRSEHDTSRIISSGEKELFLITTKSGSQVKASSEHKFFVVTKKRILEKPLSEIKVCDELLTIHEPDEIISIEPIGIWETFDLQVVKNHNFILDNGIVTHNSGSGKSISKNLLLEYYSHTHKIIHLNDINAEMWYAKKPSKRISELMRINKEPKGLPNFVIFSLPPYREEAVGREMTKIDKIVQINPKDLKIPDWVALLELNNTQQLAFSRVYREMLENLRKDKREIKDVYNIVDAVSQSEMHSGTKNSIITRLDNLVGQNVFSRLNDNTDIKDIIEDGNNYSFDTSLIYDDSLNRGLTSYILRHVADFSRRGKTTKPICIAIEELRAIVFGNIKNTRFEQYMNQTFTRLRSSGVSLITVQQNIDDLARIPGAFANTSDWLLLQIRDPKQTDKMRKALGFELGSITEILPNLEREHALYINEGMTSFSEAVAGKIILPSCHHKYRKKKGTIKSKVAAEPQRR